jgi:autotransporter-associated beta strand protein
VYSLSSTASTIDLTIGDAITAQWAVDGGGSWNVGANWNPATVPNAVGAVATFGSVLTAANAPATVTLDGNKTVGNLIFDNLNSYSIVPGTAGGITIDNGIGAPLVSAVQGSHSVSVPLTIPNPTNFNAGTGAVLTISGATGGAGSVTKIGAGTLVLSGANSYSGATLVAAGTLEAANAGALAGSPSLTVRDGAQFRVSAAATTYAGPLAFDLFGGTIANISGAASGTGNYAVDVTTGAAFTLNGLLSNNGGSVVKTGAGTFSVANGGANVLSNGTTGIGVSIQNGTLVLAGGAAATYAAAGELAVGDSTPTAGTLTLQSGTLNVSNFLSVGRGNGTTGLASTFNATGGTVNVPNFFTGFSNNVAGFLANPVVNLSGAATLNATTASRLSESPGSFTTVTMTGTATYFVQNNLEVGYGGVALVKVGAGTTLNANQFLFGNNGGSGAIWNRGTRSTGPPPASTTSRSATPSTATATTCTTRPSPRRSRKLASAAPAVARASSRSAPAR